MGAEQVSIQPAQSRKANNRLPGLPGVKKGTVVPREQVLAAVTNQMAQNDASVLLRDLEPTVIPEAPNQPQSTDPDFDKMFGSGESPVLATAEPIKAGKKGKAKSKNLMPVSGPNKHGEEPESPPTSRRQYEQEQRAIEGPYPEIVDLFPSAIEHMPLGFVGQPPQAMAVSTPPAPQPLQPQLARAYKCTQQLVHFLDDQTITLHAGQVISDPALIERLIESGISCLVPVDEMRDFITCPNCRHEFPPSAVPKQEDPFPFQFYLNSQNQAQQQKK